mgnify:FL=1|jgi:hypothetical protein
MQRAVAETDGELRRSRSRSKEFLRLSDIESDGSRSTMNYIARSPKVLLLTVTGQLGF